jgi:hypothetical protein
MTPSSTPPSPPAAPAPQPTGAPLSPPQRSPLRPGVRKTVRTPSLMIGGTVSGVLFLLIFRYVFGGAIAHTGGMSYVDFVAPGFIVTGTLFSAMSAGAGVAEDLQAGVVDRLRSLPVRAASIVCGRVLADTALAAWGLIVMTAVSFGVGFRIHREPRLCARGFRAHRRLRLRLLLAVRGAWLLRRQRAGGTAAVVPRVSAYVCVERLRPGLDDARMDASLCQPPAGHGDGEHGEDPG